MKKNNTRMLVEAGVMLAMAIVLSEFVKLFKMPMGGSVTLGGMVPLFIFAFRWGGKKGMLVGAVYGILDLIIGFYPAHPLSLLLDYPLAYGALGLAGFFKKNTTGYVCGIITGIAVRFIMHVISGVAFFASYAIEAGQAPLVYSVSYNAPYLGVEMVISIVLSLVIMKLVKLPAADNE
jgi:thiamine transporter